MILDDVVTVVLLVVVVAEPIHVNSLGMDMDGVLPLIFQVDSASTGLSCGCLSRRFLVVGLNNRTG